MPDVVVVIAPSVQSVVIAGQTPPADVALVGHPPLDAGSLESDIKNINVVPTGYNGVVPTFTQDVVKTVENCVNVEPLSTLYHI